MQILNLPLTLKFRKTYISYYIDCIIKWSWVYIGNVYQFIVDGLFPKIPVYLGYKTDVSYIVLQTARQTNWSAYGSKNTSYLNFNWPTAISLTWSRIYFFTLKIYKFKVQIS